MFKELQFFSPVDCEWNDWQHGACSKPCGGGTRINTRTKKREEENGGTCEGASKIEEDCNTEACPGKFSGIKSCNPYR